MSTVRVERVVTVGSVRIETNVEVVSPSDIMADTIARNVMRSIVSNDQQLAAATPVQEGGKP